MRIGVLEFKDDRFIADVIARFSDTSIDYITLSAEHLPVSLDYRVIIDRLSFAYPYLKEIMKNLALNGTYVINNPFAASATNKLIDINLGTRLNVPFPKTILLPNQAALAELNGAVVMPDLSRIVDELKFPCVLKPYDGYAWQDVYIINSLEELQHLYQALSSKHILIMQQYISYRDYYRVYCINKQDTLFIKWTPKPLSMGHYQYCQPGAICNEVLQRLTELTCKLNRALDLDINVVEWCMDAEGRWWIIDAFNEVPEVLPEALPPEYYAWIVDRFAACIRDKFTGSARNSNPFPLSRGEI